MKNKLLVGFVVLAIGASLIVAASSSFSKSPPGAVVEFSNNQFNPKEVIIKSGQTVTFVNKSGQETWPASNIHPTHGIYPQFDVQKSLSPKESWTFKFNRVGTWRYHDHLHPEITGQVTVE